MHCSGCGAVECWAEDDHCRDCARCPPLLWSWVQSRTLQRFVPATISTLCDMRHIGLNASALFDRSWCFKGEAWRRLLHAAADSQSSGKKTARNVRRLSLAMCSLVALIDQIGWCLS
mmetsp:Transcript_3052/g.10379  ORF Transcript_3052/g.10379 Transcript_3052/m.10379 type:complete len:117 (-) Transcript_3052:38-388(-)